MKKMKTNTYIDTLRTRNLIKAEIGDYTAYSYEDFFCGEWIGNLNIFHKGKALIHATLLRAFTKEELENELKKFIGAQK